MAFTEVGTSRRQRSTPICRSFESPGGSQWEEWTSADDAKDIVIERYPTSGRHPATIANFRSSARMAFRSGGVAGPTPRQRESWQQAAKSKSRLAAPPAAAHQLPTATSSPLCVVVPSHSPSPAPSGRRLPLDRMSPRTLAHTVCMAGQFAAADALAKNGVGGNALIIYLSSENAQVTSRPYFSYWR